MSRHVCRRSAEGLSSALDCAYLSDSTITRYHALYQAPSVSHPRIGAQTWRTFNDCVAGVAILNARTCYRAAMCVSALVNALKRKGRPEESPPWCSTRGALALSPSCSPWAVTARTRSWLLLLRAVLVLSRSRWRAPGTELWRGRRKDISRRGSVVDESVVP